MNSGHVISLADFQAQMTQLVGLRRSGASAGWLSGLYGEFSRNHVGQRETMWRLPVEVEKHEERRAARLRHDSMIPQLCLTAPNTF